MKTKKLIELINVTKTFKQNNEKIEALKKTNFSVGAGEMVAIVGPSGSGKSTLLTILGGLQTPTSGKVFIGGKQIDKISEKERSKVRLNHIGFILQASNLVPFLTIEDQLNLYEKASGRKIDSSKRQELFASLGIEKLTRKYPSELSGGERQRAAIMRALYPDPEVILADEPTASLDTKKVFEVAEILQKQTKKLNRATIIVTHDERLLSYCDKVYEMIDGVLKTRK
ncbi:MAG: ABC transporter ATP-binding protein [Candidatus Gastranaerophilales bacterium]|nr:ABC transporter ATP-binding protein [Candidatus Gastranaerophilales bacterium]